ncbi:hypothetical protein ACOSQ2_028079 [Xanthoceras sorbifolium]
MMSKIHPSTSSGSKGGDNNNNMLLREKEEDMRPCMLTVWKRSSMSFQGTDGFTVFDNQGRLVFRVDNYSRNSRRVAAAGLLLMDGAGNALLSLKPQILSMQYQWNGSRNCKIKNANGDLVAQIARKRANSTILLSDDVFSLLVYPGFGTDLVMAFVVILDRISSKPYTPVLCS